MWFFPGRKGNVPETLVGSRRCARNRFFTERTGSPINSRPFRPNSSLVRSDQRSGQTQGSRRPFVRRATAWGGSQYTPRSRCATWLESSLPPRPLALPAAAGMLAGPTREWDTRNRWPQMDYGFSRTRHHDSSSPRDLSRSDHCFAPRMQKKCPQPTESNCVTRRHSDTKISGYIDGADCHYFVTTAGSKPVKSSAIG